jgi:hypothetical protein
VKGMRRLPHCGSRRRVLAGDSVEDLARARAGPARH